MTWRKAIIKVLNQSKSAMHYNEITEEILDQGLKNPDGATPKNTVNSVISKDIDKEGEESIFKRVRQGEYMLQSWPDDDLSETDSEPPAKPESDASGEESGIVQAFGMYWQRDKVDWEVSPSLYGWQNEGAEKVNFGEQRGVYLLHDGHRVIYVGRSIRRPLGRRLYEHTKDRLGGRWDRFSWFGIMGVTQEGNLTEDVDLNPDKDKLIATLESILLESIEPPQNRKRGEGFRAVEYLQVEDPTLEDQKLAEFLDQVKNRIS
jgi:hypothetical protein